MPLLLLLHAACVDPERAPEKRGVTDTTPVADSGVPDDSGAPGVDTAAQGRLSLGGFTPRDVVVFQVDTLRADALPAWGNVRDTWPVSSPLGGWLTIERAVSTASWTAPGTASLLTALDLPAHGVRAHDDSGTNAPMAGESFATRLRDAGFATGLFTGSQLLFDSPYDLDPGFDTARLVPDEPGNAEHVVAEAGAWLATVPPETPVLLFLQPTDPHGPYEPLPEDYATWSDPDRIPFVLTDPPEQQEAEIAAALEAAPDDASRAAILEQLRLVYDEQVLGVDRAFAQLVEALRVNGRLDDTLVVLVADHGESLYDGPPAQISHGISVRNEVVRIPLAFWSTRFVDADVPCLASNMDVFPTIVDALGLAAAPDVEGRSLLQGCRDVAFSSVYQASGGVETLTWLGAETRDAQLAHDCATGELFAFDLTTDPIATTPIELSATPDGAWLGAELAGYEASVTDELPAVSCRVAP